MNRRLAAGQIAALILVLTVVLGVVDWATGYEMQFFIFYFLPVALGAWFLGYFGAVAVAVFCGIVWSCSDVLSGHK